MKDNMKEKMIEIIEFALRYNVDYVYVLEELLSILNGKDVKVTNELLKSFLD